MLATGRTLVMGVLNVTPDSFSDGGRYAALDAAVARGEALAAAGADWIDVGGESTRPGAQPVPEAAEMERVLPVIAALAGRTTAGLSVDTRKPAVARAAVAAGASLWNDIGALAAPGALAAAAELGRPVVLMHMQGEPQTMQRDPRYHDVVGEVADWLRARARAAMAAGVAREAILLDPGIGFGKTLAHNLALLARLDRLTALGFPLVLGVSRKRAVRAIDPTAVDPLDRLGGSLAMAMHGARAGVAMVRVHDVRETAQALKVQAAILDARA